MGAMWRDMAQVARDRFGQWYDLGTALQNRGDYPVCVFVENDSVDKTWWEINEFGGCGHIHTVCIQAHDDCPYYPSRDIPARWRHLAWVGNHVLEEVNDTHDVVLYVESDLLWTTDAMLRLIDQAVETGDAVVAMNMHANGNYYDIWGSSIRGTRFKPSRPFHPALDSWESGLVPCDSACGAIAMPGSLARQVRFQPEDCFVGLCRDVRAKGHAVWLDPSVSVIHP